MNEADFREILAREQEGRHVEFKRSVPWDHGDFKWKIVKSVLAFSNVRDGGAIIIGVDETDDGFEFTGIEKDHRATYDEDDIREKVATRADPYATCRLEDHTDETGNQYAVIDVDQFDEMPVICKRDGPCNLYEGALYTRSYRMPESVPVPSQTEMRRILDMAVEEQLRRHYQRQERFGAGQDRLTAAEQFASELDDVDVDILDKIKRHGFWKVVIRPTTYEEDRLTLDQCRQAVADNVVFFRGWDYPHTERSDIIAGPTWIQHTTDWSQYVEWWRMTQSGQFVHLFGIQEDWEPEEWVAGYEDTEPGQALSVLNALYAITEIFEFASRLATTPVLEDRAYVEISLTGLEGRTLIMLDPGRTLRGRYTCGEDHLPRNWTPSTEELLGRSRELALDYAGWLFTRFNWQNVPLEVLEEDQEKLIEGRL